MSKSDPSAAKKERNKSIRWAVSVFFVTILVSGLISFGSEELMSVSSTAVAFLVLLAIVLIGVVFDAIGMAVASADEKPFHSMAARKVPGAQEAIALLRNAERVSSICNDVFGDICGVVSGSASATIAVQLLQNFDLSWGKVIPLLLSALVAGITVGAKAIGKYLALNFCTSMVHGVGVIIYHLSHIPDIFRRKKK